MATGRRYLKIDEVGDYLGCPNITAHKLLDAGKLPTVKVGAGILIDRRLLDLKLKNQKDGWRVLLKD